MKKLTLVFVGVLLFFLVQKVAAADVFTVNLRYGVRNPVVVKQLQQFLKDQGFFSAGITGNYYAVTQTAVKNFQRAQGLTVNGIFDQTTRARANELVVSRSEPVVTVTPSVPTTPSVVTAPEISKILLTTKGDECVQKIATEFSGLLNSSSGLAIKATEDARLQTQNSYQTCLSTQGAANCITLLSQLQTQLANYRQLVVADATASKTTGVRSYEDYLQAVSRCKR